MLKRNFELAVAVVDGCCSEGVAAPGRLVGRGGAARSCSKHRPVTAPGKISQKEEVGKTVSGLMSVFLSCGEFVRRVHCNVGDPSLSLSLYILLIFDFVCSHIFFQVKMSYGGIAFLRLANNRR